MKFYPVYYFTLACPTIEKAQEMIDKYVEKSKIIGVQLDMPSNDPYGETDFVKKMMADALEKYKGNYQPFMDAIKNIRKKHPGLVLHIVVYPDVIDSFGIEKFTQFCGDIGAFTVRSAGTETYTDYIKYLNDHGIYTSDDISYFMPEEDIQRCTGTKGIIHMRTKTKTESPNRGFETWEQRIKYVRSKGITARIFATADMKTAGNLEEAKKAGADGVYVGNVLMKLWNDESAGRCVIGAGAQQDLLPAGAQWGG
jgi:tryptophan synthase alpha chain